MRQVLTRRTPGCPTHCAAVKEKRVYSDTKTAAVLLYSPSSYHLYLAPHSSGPIKTHEMEMNSGKQDITYIA